MWKQLEISIDTIFCALQIDHELDEVSHTLMNSCDYFLTNHTKSAAFYLCLIFCTVSKVFKHKH